MNASTAKAIAGALLTCGAMVAGIGLAGGTAEAQPTFRFTPAPDGGPWTWCPGQDMSGINTTTGRGGPGIGVDWDMTVCHTWYGVNWGWGNVTPYIWDGPDPPPEGIEIRQCPPISFLCP